jgi:molybdopterin adenylyltransferase
MARVVSINVSRRKGVKKEPVHSANLIEGVGIEGDAHAMNGKRQVSLLAAEDIMGAAMNPGDFAENITTEGIDLSTVRIGDALRIGRGVLLRISQIGKECHTRCAIYNDTGDCIMPKKGIFAQVVAGGAISVGDEVSFI